MTGGWGAGGIFSGLTSLFGNGSAPGDLGGIFGRKGGNGKGKGNGGGEGDGTEGVSPAGASEAVIGTMGRGKSAGGVLAKLKGSSVAADALTAPGDANATGVLEITLLQNGTDYDVAFTACISLSTDAAPTALTLNSGSAGTTGATLLDFSTAMGADGMSPPAWTSVASPSPGSGPMGHAWGRLQRAAGRSALVAGLHTFTLTGVWRAAATVAAADGVQTVKDVALAVVAQPPPSMLCSLLRASRLCATEMGMTTFVEPPTESVVRGPAAYMRIGLCHV
ncbi:unnamed protein product [Closterium sp. Yama58-4]|nr:unnamed protein product [Closterium sp. Yama58-4]